MNPYPPPDPYYYPPAPPPRHSKWGLVIAFCVGLAVATIVSMLLGVAGFAFYEGFKDGEQQALESIADGFIWKLSRHKYEQAYTEVHSDWQAVEEVEEFSEEYNEIIEDLGKLDGLYLRLAGLDEAMDGDEAILMYYGEFRSTWTEITVTLSRELTGEWKVYSCVIEPFYDEIDEVESDEADAESAISESESLIEELVPENVSSEENPFD